MFTLDLIMQAHAHVKSGADFPAYINAIQKLGVESYETYVHDGHANYNGQGQTLTGQAKYTTLAIAEHSDGDSFVTYLKAHQQGKSDYPTFCKQAALTGIEKWVVNTNKRTCAYFDKQGNEILLENIPE
jgi:uncharacterized protein YbcV (DUF1398 family)